MSVMTRSRRRGRGGPRPPSGQQEGAKTPRAPAPPREAAHGNKGQQMPPMLRIALERATDMVKRELGERGRVAPTAVFGYQGEAGPGDEAVHIFKAVSIAWRTELQKEAVRKRVREKTAAEGAVALVILTRAAGEGPRTRQKESPELKGTLVFTGAVSGARGVARVDYVLQKEAGHFTSWDVRISSETLENFFLNGLFPPPRQAR